MQSAPSTARKRTLFDPFLPGGCDVKADTDYGPSLEVDKSGGSLPRSLVLGERNAGTRFGPALIRFNAASTSSIDRKRSSGDLRIQRAMVSSNAGDASTLGFISRREAAASLTCEMNPS